MSACTIAAAAIATSASLANGCRSITPRETRSNLIRSTYRCVVRPSSAEGQRGGSISGTTTRARRRPSVVRVPVVSKEGVMNRYTDRTLDRLGAASGVAAVVLLISLFTVFPALPAPNKAIAEIARSARQDADGLLLGAYVGTLLTGTLLVFGAVVAARLRRAEGAGGGWWLVALAGIGASGIGI